MSDTRHTLCYLHQRATPIPPHALEQHRLFQYWLECGYPFICTRQPQELASGQIQLAIPYFNQQQGKKLRASYLVSRSWLTHTKALPDFHDVFPLIKLNTHIEIKVYGSYCWQYLTQEPYVQPTSDLDVLIYYTRQSLIDLMMLYQELQNKSNVPHIDGEVRFPYLGDCSLQELLQPSDSILFKSINEVTLLTREKVYAAYPSLLI